MNTCLSPASRETLHNAFVKFLIVFLTLVASAAAATAPNVTGSWTGTFSSAFPNGDSGPITVTLTENSATGNLTGFLSVPGSSCLAGGGAISGRVYPNGQISFGNIAIAGGAGPNAITFTGTVTSASQMSGLYSVQAPCASDTGSWQLTIGSPVAAICPDCVHTIDGTPIVNTLAMWSATSPAFLTNSLFTQDSAGNINLGPYLSMSSIHGGIVASGPNGGITGRDTNTVGPNIGVFGEADGDNGAGVLGYAPACSAAAPCTPSPTNPNAGFTAGVRGVASGTNGYGVRGFNGSSTGTTHGIEGRVSSPDGRGAEGWNTSTSATGTPIGVYGHTASPKGVAVWGAADTTAAVASNSTIGVFGSGKTGTAGFASVGDQGVGVWGANFSQSGWTRGVLAQMFSPDGEALAVEAPNGGNLLVGRSGANFNQVLRVTNNGDIHIAGTVFSNGADFAEAVAVEGTKQEYEPGDVLVIDEDATRQLTVAAEPYSVRVAGIYSTKPGVLASPTGMANFATKNEVPLAVVGIVPCKVSAENGAIRVGDLLVTASRAGYAMKGTDRGRMLGAIVGKALEPLHAGTGVIQVLVTLQ